MLDVESYIKAVYGVEEEPYVRYCGIADDYRELKDPWDPQEREINRVYDDEIEWGVEYRVRVRS